MKRSEVLSYLYNYLYDFGIESLESDEASEEILSGLEELGMLPPSVDRNLEHSNARFIYTWESEHEI